MTRKFIPGLIGAALVAGCLSAQAMPAGDADLTHNYAVTGLAHKGNYVTDFVQGRLITAAPRAAAFTMTNADADRATRYASESAMLTIVFLAIAAALAGYGKPGLREDYGPNYFAAFVVDPDGYRIEAYSSSES